MHNGDVVDQATVVQLGNQAVDLRRAEEEVDLGKGVRELLLVPLDHAPYADDGAAGARLLQTPRFDECVDGLLLRRVDESAGIDDDDVGRAEIGGEFRPAIRELRDVALAIDGVFVAAEGEDRKLQSGGRLTVDG